MGKEYDETCTIDALPYYDFDINDQTSVTDSISLTVLAFNNFSGYALIKKKNELFGYGEKSYGGYSLDLITEFDSRELKPGTRLRLMQAVEKLSPTYFVIHFLPYDYIPGFIEFLSENRIKILDSNKHVYTITQFLCHRYGSVQKYVELSQKEATKKMLYSTKIAATDPDTQLNNCIKILRSSYRTFSIYEPNDTAKVLTVFLTEMDSILKLNKCQQQLLYQKIMMQFSPGGRKYIPGSDGIYFYGFNIKPVITSILTEKEFALYQQGRNNYNYLYSSANDYLRGYFMEKVRKGKWSVTKEEREIIDVMMKKAILGN